MRIIPLFGRWQSFNRMCYLPNTTLSSSAWASGQIKMQGKLADFPAIDRPDEVAPITC